MPVTKADLESAQVQAQACMDELRKKSISLNKKLDPGERKYLTGWLANIIAQTAAAARAPKKAPLGQRRRRWREEQKRQIVKEALESTVMDISRKYAIDPRLLFHWKRQYIDEQNAS